MHVVPETQVVPPVLLANKAELQRGEQIWNLLTIQFHRIVDKRPAGRPLTREEIEDWLIGRFVPLEGKSLAQVLSGSMAFQLWLATTKLRLVLSEETSLEGAQLPVIMHMTIVPRAADKRRIRGPTGCAAKIGFNKRHSRYAALNVEQQMRALTMQYSAEKQPPHST